MKSYRADDRLIAEQAAQWQQALERGGQRERTAFAAWLLESRRNVRNYLLLTAFDRELKHLDPHHTQDVDALIAEAKAEATPLRRSLPAKEVKAVRYWPWIGAAVAGIGALAIAAQWSSWPLLNTSAYTTSTGEQQTLKLEDGSVVYLNTQSKLRLGFSDRRREVRLLSGEALFVVERDPARPFNVVAGSANVQVLGTQFNVRQGTDTVVSVLEGRVQVKQDVLSAGEEARIDGRGRVNKQPARDVARRIAWRQRLLEFRDEPLANVVAEFNRYNRAPRFRIEGDEVARRNYTGVFKADDPQSLAQLLSQEEDLILQRGEDEIVIRSR